MFAQFTLTSSEGKKLISKAVIELDLFKKAFKKGMIVIHPSSTTFFILNQLFPGTYRKIWVCGILVPRGACIEAGMIDEIANKNILYNPGDFPFSWVIKNGILQEGYEPISSILERLTNRDIYIKGINAVDSQGKGGVLLGNQREGVIGKVLAASRKKGFNMILPVGLEKLIPLPIEEAAEKSRSIRKDFSMGLPVNLIPVPGTIINELDSIKTLTGAEAIPIASGGLSGAEGGLTFIARGKRGQIGEAIDIITSVKGARLPKLRLKDCSKCKIQTCQFNKKIDSMRRCSHE